MVAYKLKVIHVEDYTINFSPIRQNINGYTMKYNNCGDYSSKFIPDYGNLWDTVIHENTDISSNRIPEIRNSVLSYLHSAGTKHRIYSSKTYTTKNVTIQKITESIKSKFFWMLMMIKE